MLKGFREFILRGNVLDLAVGVVIGAAFGAVVTSFTKDVLMQLISAVAGKPDFKEVVFTLNNTPIFVGNFLTALISFLLVAGAVYFAVIVPVNALMSRINKPAPVAAPTTKTCPECTMEIPLGARRCPNCTSSVGPTALSA
jgi:large conductance mechanosensitive channel